MESQRALRALPTMVKMVEWDEKQSSYKLGKSSLPMKGRDGISETHLSKGRKAGDKTEGSFAKIAACQRRWTVREACVCAHMQWGDCME